VIKGIAPVGSRHRRTSVKADVQADQGNTILLRISARAAGAEDEPADLCSHAAGWGVSLVPPRQYPVRGPSMPISPGVE
jgi:hypothetical protein